MLSHRLRTIRILPPLFLLTILVQGCATAPAPPDIQWPQPPFPPRIAWVEDIHDYREAGITKGWWRRVVDFVTGDNDQGIGKAYGVYADDHGRLIVADTGYSAVHIMDKTGNTYTVIGTGENGLLQTPIGVTEDDADNLYITDSTASVVYRYHFRDGTLSPFITSLKRPTGIAFSKKKRLLFVADTAASRVVAFDPGGAERFAIGREGTEPGEFNHPTDLFVDGRDTLYVTDPLNSRIQIFSSQGEYKGDFGEPGDAGGELSKPKGVASDSDGNIYIVDTLSDTVKVYNSSGGFLFRFGENGTGPGRFWMPSGLHIDHSDKIYVSDTYNRRIQVFRRITADAPAAERR